MSAASSATVIPLSGSGCARYVAERHVISERFAKFEIGGPADGQPDFDTLIRRPGNAQIEKRKPCSQSTLKVTATCYDGSGPKPIQKAARMAQAWHNTTVSYCCYANS